jgi:acetyl-CoA carboxylase biotin carboxyl carrier protein
MALSDDDVREILRIIEESDLAEIKVETEGFSLHVRRGAKTGASAPAAATGPPASAQPASSPPEDHRLTIQAPMLGTFYRAEGPGEKPFVDIGSEVGPNTTVCIIEVMKMMNSVPAGVEGTVVEVLVKNAELVEYGQPLFRVHPQ